MSSAGQVGVPGRPATTQQPTARAARSAMGESGGRGSPAGTAGRRHDGPHPSRRRSVDGRRDLAHQTLDGLGIVGRGLLDHEAVEADRSVR